MKDFLTHILTDGSNQYFDYAKIMGVIALFAFIGISAVTYIYKSVNFDPLTWATGISIIIGAAGGVSKLADKSGVQNDNTAA